MMVAEEGHVAAEMEGWDCATTIKISMWKGMKDRRTP